MKPNNDKKKLLTNISLLLVLFGLFSFGTAIVVNSPKVLLQKELSEKINIIGPIEISKKNTVLSVSLKQNLASNGAYNYVTAELLDNKKEYVFGFGDEFSFETGRDSDGQWTEQKNKFSVKLTIPKAGKYYFKFSTESNIDTDKTIKVNVSTQKGSTLPHTLLGIFLLICAVLVNEVNNSTLRIIYKKLDEARED